MRTNLYENESNYKIVIIYLKQNYFTGEHVHQICAHIIFKRLPHIHSCIVSVTSSDELFRTTPWNISPRQSYTNFTRFEIRNISSNKRCFHAIIGWSYLAKLFLISHNELSLTTVSYPYGSAQKQLKFDFSFQSAVLVTNGKSIFLSAPAHSGVGFVLHSLSPSSGFCRTTSV